MSNSSRANEVRHGQEQELGTIKRLHQRSSYKKAHFICFPEFQMGFSPSDQKPIELSGISETVNTGNFVKSLSRYAKEYMELIS